MLLTTLTEPTAIARRPDTAGPLAVATPTTRKLADASISVNTSRAYLVAAGLFLASSMTGFAQAPENEVRCSYGSRFTCNQSGCQPLEVEGAFLLVPRLDTIRTAFPGEKPPEVRRCDESGCTPVEVINGE